MSDIPIVVTRAAAIHLPETPQVDHPGEVRTPSVVVTTAGDCDGPGRQACADCRLIVLGDPPDDELGEFFFLLPLPVSDRALARAIRSARQSIADQIQLRFALRSAGDRQALQKELLEIGTALSAERDLNRLLERILSTARQLVLADAGSLYLLEEGPGGARLRFVLAQNESCDGPWRESVMPVDSASLAGVVAQSGESLSINDAYSIPEDASYSFNPSFDRESGYHTRSLLAVPMKNRTGNLLGVIQLINRKQRLQVKLTDRAVVDSEVIPFTAADLSLLQALASQAAVVLENSRLVQEIRDLFESFVLAAVTAIEQRDPPTSGHSLRVASYTLGLAAAVERDPPPRFRGVRFSDRELQQLRYAALLHDFGKLGVREPVLTKSKKLYPDQERLVRERFLHACRALQKQRLEVFLEDLHGRGTALTDKEMAWITREMERLMAEFDALYHHIECANNPAVIGKEVTRHLVEIARRKYPGRDDVNLPLLRPEELHFLQIERGNLDEAERREIESHVVHSLHFLKTLPWPRDLRRVPEIAALHHEKLNGRGYPHRYTQAQIPLEARMLSIADIYDALTSGDRPYKASLEPATALAILRAEAEAGALDSDLVELFIKAEVYRRVPENQ